MKVTQDIHTNATDPTGASSHEGLTSKSPSSRFYLAEDDDDDDDDEEDDQETPLPPHPSFHQTIPQLRVEKCRQPSNLSLSTSSKSSSPEPNSHGLSLETRPVQPGIGHQISRFNSASSTTSSSPARDASTREAILQFPIESTHAYSYAHLSPNSLALRLNVLKRSLQILKERPVLFHSIKKESERSASHSQPPLSPFLPTPSSTIRSLYKNPSANNSQELQPTSKIQANASSAALAAFFRPTLQRSDSLPINQLYSTREVSPLGSSKLSELQAPSSGLPVASYQSGGASNVKEERSRSASGVSSERGSRLASGKVRSRSSQRSKSASGTAHSTGPSTTKSDFILNNDLRDIITILESDQTLVEDNSEIALNLHQLSLASGSDSFEPVKQDYLVHKLLYALATPFIESSLSPPALLSSEYSETRADLISPASAMNLFQYGQNAGGAPASNPHEVSRNGPNGSNTPELSRFSSSASANTASLTPTPTSASNSRPFHGMASKTPSPQSVFTVDTDSPWSIKAANDLACLMFGVSKGMIRSLTLMDLVAPQFRQFVSDKISTATADNNSNNIIFAGEIVAVVRPGAADYAWTSIWAKRRGKLIICMFDQIPCDAFDVEVGEINKQVCVKSVKNMTGRLIPDAKITSMREISHSIEDLLNGVDESFEACQNINSLRYFTLQLPGEQSNLPCAVTSIPMEDEDYNLSIKVKVHSLPYIAGIFVISSDDHTILSCNNAIAKNLFGKSSGDLLGKSIDLLVPDFSLILTTGLAENTFSLVPGLVLPEHFFRKYDAKRRSNEGEEEEEEEELFFTSRGVRGIHRDGEEIWVDIQLRVTSSDAFVLWITYSRSASGNSMAEELDRLSASTSSLSLYGGSRVVGEKGGVDLPSQMDLFPEDESDLVELGGSTDVSRAGSVRRKDKSDVSQTSRDNKDSLAESQTTLGSNSTQASSPKSSTSPEFTKKDTTSEKNDPTLKESTKESGTKSLFPTTVGAQRRTKKFSEFTVIKDMGEGAYGKVVLAIHKEDPAYKIIIKCIDKERILVDTWVRDRRLGTIPSEINIMAFLNTAPHPNIMAIIDFFEDSKYYYLETPLFGDPPAIDLFDFIEIRKNMTESECRLIFRQVASAVQHLHHQGIVHRDIKDENVIVDEHGDIKLIDFGSAGYAKSGPFDVFVGTIDYASPEVLRGERYAGQPQDMWAMGILLYTVLFKENPFYNVDEIMEGDLRIPYGASEGAEALIRRILVRAVDERPTIDDVVNDPWLNL
ncbi:serine/threonine-protein kinase Psk1p [[Candida] anglica]|uniref:Serine/threonine-protein kinase Psk1p n=1 Tax=[Candida] anglica TaxID=148631 RepID=A0ABP0EAI8_9ASCO